MSFRQTIAALALVALSSGAVQAQGYTGWSSGGRSPWAQAGSNPVLGNAEPGKWAAGVIGDASAYCSALPDRTYQIDCLSERLAYIAWQLDPNGPYGQTRKTLEDCAKRLADTAWKYRDTARTPKRFRTPQGADQPQTTTRPLSPVRPEAAAPAIAQARAIVADAATVLLRSSASDATVASNIKLIAAAVGSNKVLLRSI